MFEDRKKAGVIGAEWLREASSGCWQGPSHAGLRRQLALGFHYDHSKPLGSIECRRDTDRPWTALRETPQFPPCGEFPPGNSESGGEASEEAVAAARAKRCGLAWARRCGGQREGVESGRVQEEGRQALLPGWMRGARRRGRSSGFGVKNWGVGVSVLQGGKTR